MKKILSFTITLLILITFVISIKTVINQKSGKRTIEKNISIVKQTSKSEKSENIQSANVNANTNTNTNTSITRPIKEVDGFVLLKDMDNDFVIDLRYATTNNFTKKKVYPNAICVLRKSTAEKLVKANAEFKKLGYRIKIWDAYRPVSVQIIFWNLVKDDKYVANPYAEGSIHNKGCAVDITLVDKNSNEIEMPSGFDDFTSKAFRTSTDMTVTARKNLDTLTKVMTDCGFTTIDSEWWHFNDTASDKFKITDMDLNLFLVPDKNENKARPN